MSKIIHLELSGLSPDSAVLEASTVLENGHQHALTVGLNTQNAAAEVEDFLQSVGLKTQIYSQGNQWLVLGHPSDSPEILVWYGPDGWQTAIDGHHRHQDYFDESDDDPIIDLPKALTPGPTEPAPPNINVSKTNASETIVLVGSQFMGTEDKALGAKIATSFFDTLVTLGQPVNLVAFYNTGVYLTTRESSIVVALRDLEKSGATIISCGISLDALNLLDDLKVGRIGNMYEIINAQRSAVHVIRL